MLTLILLILKILGIAVSGVLGIIGTITQTKTPDGRLTKAGRWGLCFCIAGALVALFAQITEQMYDTHKDRELAQSTKTQVDKSSMTLSALENEGTKIDRVLNGVKEQSELTQQSLVHLNQIMTKIKSINVTVRTRVPLASVVFDGFREQLNGIVRQAWDDLRNGRGSRYALGVGDEYGQQIATLSLSRLAGDGIISKTAVDYFLKPAFEFKVFLHKMSPTDFQPLASQPDLWFTATPHTPDLKFNTKTNELDALYFMLESDHTYWRTTGKVTSLADLAGAHVFVFIDHAYKNTHKIEPNPQFAPLVTATQVLHVDLRINESDYSSRLMTHLKELPTFKARDGVVFATFDIPREESSSPALVMTSSP